MPTILSHAIAAAALGSAFPVPTLRRRVMAVGAFCAMVPDLDVIGFRFGVRYGDLLGHRGLSHSLLIAAVIALVALWTAFRRKEPAEPGKKAMPVLWLFLFAATASHGLLDAMTNGGRGVALLSPFDPQRIFFPWTPIQVSPIGAGFFTGRGLAVLESELVWIGLPAVGFFLLIAGLRSAFKRRGASIAS